MLLLELGLALVMVCILLYVVVSETLLLAWICGEEAKYMEGLKMHIGKLQIIQSDMISTT